MTLPDRETVRAVGRPQFANVLQQQGRPVLIRRPELPDVEARALVIPVTSNSRTGEKISNPEVKSLAWKVFFAHDVDAVRLPGFTLIFPEDQGQPMQELTPTTPAVDVADQGVVLILTCSVLAERSRTETLTFIVPSNHVGRDPLTGNPLPSAGRELVVAARLVPTDDPRVRDMVGADTAEVVLLGRWGSLEMPGRKPEGVHWGSTSPLTLDGQRGVITVKLAYPDPDLWQEQQFGQRFVAIWRAS